MQIFNATDYDPEQGTPKHPIGQHFDAYISNTEFKPGKEGKGMAFVVTFTTQQGQISKMYNIEHDNETTQRIARNHLSALCHAVKTYQLDWAQHGAALRNKQLKIDVTAQANDAKYNEVSKVYDSAGNLPTKAAPMSAPQPGQGQPQPQFAPQPQAFAPPVAPGGTPFPQQAPQGFQPPPQQFAPQPMQAPQPQQQAFQPQPMQMPSQAMPGQLMPTQKPDWAK